MLDMMFKTMSTPVKTTPVKTKKNFSPAEMVRQVKQEIKRISWPSRKETGLSTLMVAVLVIISSIFFLTVDSLISWVIKMFLSL